MAKPRKRKRKTNFLFLMFAAIILLAAGYGMVHFGLGLYEKYAGPKAAPVENRSSKKADILGKDKKEMNKKKEVQKKSDYSERDKKALENLLDSER